MALYYSTDELIGATPLLLLSEIGRKYSLGANIYAKLEFMNPCGSIKDRAAKSMLDDAERRGLIAPGSVIIEPTSGNTGIGLASIGTRRGYRVIIVMPDSMSPERIKVMRAYGAEVVLTPGALGMSGAIAEAERLAAEYEGSFIPSQFDNTANRDAHYRSTGPEIYSDLDGKVDIFLAGAGTGGTVSGVGRYLKEKRPEVKVYAVEPEGSAVLSGGKAGPHALQGIGAGFVPSIYDAGAVDGVLTVSDSAAYEAVRMLAREEGLLVGISSGAAIDAAIRLAALPENKGKNIVTVFPDTGLRYLSVKGLFPDGGEA